MSKRTHKQKRDAIEIEIAYMKEGDNQTDIAKRSGFPSREAMLIFIKREPGMSPFSALKKSIKGILTHPTPISDWVKVPTDFSKRLQHHIDPIVSTEDRSFRNLRAPIARETDTVWGSEIEAIPDRYIQPIKRIRIAAHTFLNSGLWNNDEHLYNATVKIAQDKADLYLTQEDAAIISSDFNMREGIRVGDKLLGINGLKVTVCLIRDQDTDLVVNEKQIFGDKASRHTFGAVREMRDRHLQIFFTKENEPQLTKAKLIKLEQSFTSDEIKLRHEQDIERWNRTPKGRSYSYHKARFSPTLITFLEDIFGNEIHKIMTSNAKDVQEVLQTLNAEFKLTLKGLTLEALTTQPEEGFEWDGAFWGSTEWREYLSPHPSRFDIGETKGITAYPFIQYKIPIGDFITRNKTFINKRGERKDSDYYKKLLQPHQHMHGKAIAWFLHKAVFGDIDNSLTGLVAIPINIDDKRTILISPGEIHNIKLNPQKDIIVYREPVVSKQNIQVCKLKVDKDIPIGKIGVSVELMKEFYGDFDGDELSIIGTKDIKHFADRLRYNLKPIDLVKPVGLPKDIPKARTEDEQIALARAEHEDILSTSRDIGNIGSLTKIAFIKTNAREVVNVKSNTQALEIMKDRSDLIQRAEFDNSVDTLSKIAGRKWYDAFTTIVNGSPKVFRAGFRFSPRGIQSWAAFNSFITTNNYKKGLNTVDSITKILSTPTSKKVLCSVDSPYAKWIILLSKIKVTTTIILPEKVHIATIKDIRGREVKLSKKVMEFIAKKEVAK